MSRRDTYRILRQERRRRLLTTLSFPELTLKQWFSSSKISESLKNFVRYGEYRE